ncbi:MAG: 50S ribosomal protein L3 N(5)-glutamine methyltransferase [Pseudomonadales bacterium]
MNDLDVASKELHTVRDFIRWGTSRFNENRLYFGHGTDNAWDESVQLVMRALHLPMESGGEVLDARLTSEERKLLTVVIATRIKERIPVAYLNGEAWFAGLRFKADERALIPRSPIAELIERGFEPWKAAHEIGQVLDLCTGGGCIGIAAAHYLPDARVTLADLSEPALELAAINVREHHMQPHIDIYHSDLFSSLPENETYDLIVSNPPYVDAEDFASMPAEYRHEPEMALTAGDDGLDIVHRILREASHWLNDQGVLIVEVGNSQPALEASYPAIAFNWLEFERGGHGVFALDKSELQKHF